MPAQNLLLPVPASFLTLISMRNLKSVTMSLQPRTSASVFPATVWNRSMWINRSYGFISRNSLLFCSLTHTRTHLPQAYRNIWRYETAPHKMLSSAFAQFFQSCPYWFPPARPADPVSVPPRYVAFLNSSGTPSHHITIPLIFRDSPSAPKM